MSCQIGEEVQGATVTGDGRLLQLPTGDDACRIAIADGAGVERVENRIDRVVEVGDRVRHIRPEGIPEAVNRVEQVIGGVELLDRFVPTERILQSRKRLDENPDGTHCLTQLAADLAEYVGDLVRTAGQSVQIAGVAVDHGRGLVERGSDLAGLKRQPRLLQGLASRPGDTTHDVDIGHLAHPVRHLFHIGQCLGSPEIAR